MKKIIKMPIGAIDLNKKQDVEFAANGTTTLCLLFASALASATPLALPLSVVAIVKAHDFMIASMKPMTEAKAASTNNKNIWLTSIIPGAQSVSRALDSIRRPARPNYLPSDGKAPSTLENN